MFPEPAEHSPVQLVVLGAGSRGLIYASWAATHPNLAHVVAVADPDELRRTRLAELCGVPPEAQYDSWQSCLAAGQLGHAALVCTQDADHVAPALRALELGYHLLLEKPIAQTFDEVRRVTDAAAQVEAEGRVFAVGHVLRYTPYTLRLKQLLDAGAVGEIVSIQHIEPVNWRHQAHSYVRGNWRRTDESSFMLLAKSCHDLDWLEYIVANPIKRLSSFGSLKHFRADQAPEDAALRCVDCPLENDCAYSATRIYLGPCAAPPDQWPTAALTSACTREAVEEALREGPYGRCVYQCDNDVVDHQVVSMEFENGCSGVFTMTAFTGEGHRSTRIFGTQGQIDSDGRVIKVCDFRNEGRWTEYDTGDMGAMDAGGGHGGGDDGLMAGFVDAILKGDPMLVSSNAETSLRSHIAVFAAEQARLDGTVVKVTDFR